MTEPVVETPAEIAAAIVALRTRLAAEQAELADLCLRYVELRRAEAEHERVDLPQGIPAPAPGSFAADEVAVLLGVEPAQVTHLVARTHRLRDLPATTAAARAGRIDGDRCEAIDKAARFVENGEVLTKLDTEAVEVAADRTSRGLQTWLHRFLARHEPEALTRRRNRALADRRVTVAQSVTGIGYVTGETTAEAADAIDARLSALASGLGSGDPRTHHQRRADIFAGVLLGTLVVDVDDAPDALAQTRTPHPAVLEVEQVDPATGEYLGTRSVPVDPEGDPIEGSLVDGPPTGAEPLATGTTVRQVIRERAGRLRIGVVVPVGSLLGVDDTPGELADRSAMIPAEAVRELAAAAGTLFTRLLVDPGGHLLDVAELGRFPSARLSEAVRLRAGTCVFPGCRVPANRCDLDHHDPVPRGPTSGANLDPLCRRHHRGKTFAGLAARRDEHTVTWTLPTAHTYRCLDDPLPLRAATDDRPGRGGP